MRRADRGRRTGRQQPCLRARRPRAGRGPDRGRSAAQRGSALGRAPFRPGATHGRGPGRDRRLARDRARSAGDPRVSRCPAGATSAWSGSPRRITASNRWAAPRRPAPWRRAWRGGSRPASACGAWRRRAWSRSAPAPTRSRSNTSTKARRARIRARLLVRRRRHRFVRAWRPGHRRQHPRLRPDRDRGSSRDRRRRRGRRARALHARWPAGAAAAVAGPRRAGLDGGECRRGTGARARRRRLHGRDPGPARPWRGPPAAHRPPPALAAGPDPRRCARPRPRAVLVGNAAQTLHPIGAQGFNLGLRDAMALAREIAAAQRDGADPGAPVAARRATPRPATPTARARSSGPMAWSVASPIAARRCVSRAASRWRRWSAGPMPSANWPGG